ncbi:hypothetical protein BH18ACT11_BH18ACT11_25050 [soil metagenome]
MVYTVSRITTQTGEERGQMKTSEVRIPEGEWLTLREGAAYARMSYQNFTQAVKKGEIPGYVPPGYTRTKRVKKADVDTWIESRRVGV